MRIELKRVSYRYNEGWPDEVSALTDVSATFQSGEIVAILGREGSGKSTLLQHINGLIAPSNGEVLLDGAVVTPQLVASLRARIGMVFQYPEHQLFAPTLVDDIGFALRRRGIPEAETARRISKAGAIVGLDIARLGKRRPFELSGGERRRAAIAGALVTQPELMLLDEPFAGLDPLSQCELAWTLRRLRDEWGTGMAIVSHSLEETLPLANKTIVLHKGKVVFDGLVDDLLQRRTQLEEWGLRLPVTVQFADMLRARGVKMEKTLWRIEDVARALASQSKPRSELRSKC